jgi:uncharacterized protein YeaO (DUF488 family)
MVILKRIYDKAEKEDGFRVLVDRLWPRGLSKQKASLGLWLKEIAPSTELRKWFNHEPKKWKDFEKKYKAELEGKQGLIEQLKHLEKENHTLTILYGARDREHNEAQVLLTLLQSPNESWDKF